jgi:isoleucyl-tRNA synthetase
MPLIRNKRKLLQRNAVFLIYGFTADSTKLVQDVQRFMKSFETHKAARAIEGFIIDDFSNWYLRRSRKRLWVEEKTPDKLSGYFTMYEIFVGLSQLLAPFIPFISEEIYQNLRTADMPESVHLCDYPCVDDKAIDEDLEKGMERIRTLVEAGRALRAKSKRQRPTTATRSIDRLL